MSKVRPFSRQWFTPRAVHATCDMLTCCAAAEVCTQSLGLETIHALAWTIATVNQHTHFLLKLWSMAAALIGLKRACTSTSADKAMQDSASL